MTRARVSGRRLAALIHKEFAQIARDPSTFIIAFALPLVLLFIIGYAISLDVARTKVVLVVEDSSSAANSLATAFARSPYFDVRSARSVEAVGDVLVEDEARGIIVIPQGFGRGVQAGDPPPIQLIADGSQPNTARFVAAHVEGVRANWAAAELGQRAASRPQVDLSTRFWFNTGLRSRNFLVPGSIAIVMTMIGTLLTALVIAREWERGTMEAMMATPMSMTEFIASKVVPYYLLGLGSMTVCALFAVFVFQVPFRGNPLTLFVIASAFLMPALGMGLLISAATRNQFVATQVALITGFLPAFLLSGFLYEISSMPWPVQLLTYVVPARYLIPPLQTVFMAGDQWGLILPNIATMLLFGLFFFFLAFRVTRRSLD